MWVVKLGGSLNTGPQLREWLQVLVDAGAGRAVLVCGGGPFADAVRESQAHWKFDELAAHNMALLAMVQTAYLLRALQPALHLVHDETTIAPALKAGRVVLWTPLDQRTEHADADTSWDVSSDSLALALAQRLHTSAAAQGGPQVLGLVVVKSCAVDPQASLPALVQAGVLDARFATWAARQPLPIHLLHAGQAERLRALLQGGAAGPQGGSGLSRTI